MTQKKLTNVGASVRQRLLNLARERSEDFNLLLTRYGVERCLYRLSVSPHSSQFILKGAVLFNLWRGEPNRPTRDLDLLGFGSPDHVRLERIFREVCTTAVPDDGLRFDSGTVSSEEIREDDRYAGIRVHLGAELAGAKIPVQVDIGFGDAVSPPPTSVELPTILDFPPPKIRAYPPEVVVAEKFEAMVSLGIANSRMKDFFDIRFLSRTMEFEGKRLTQAVAATFKARKTTLPEGVPVALTPDFADNPDKRGQWQGFVRKVGFSAEAGTLGEVCDEIARFLLPVIDALRQGSRFGRRWPPGGPWSVSPVRKK